MRRFLLLATTAVLIASSETRAQTDLTAYVDGNGFLDVQALTCAQLAGTWQQDADALMPADLLRGSPALAAARAERL